MAISLFSARSKDATDAPALVLKRNTRAQRGVAAATTMALVLFGTTVVLVGSGLATPLTAEAAPAATAAAQSFTATGSIGNVIVPAGVCAVQATVVGGAGASAMDTVSSANGAAASIVATYPVLPGQILTGTVAAGGKTPSTDGVTTGAAGAPGGAAGGTSGAVSGTRHPGAGGGGYSELLIAGARAILAGGGGGTAGGHSTTTLGFGGNAGIPGAAAGTFAGSAGTGGKDTPVTTVTGGGGGSFTGGTAGTNAADASINGVAGASLAAGRGGNDSNPDAGGGGGGGLFGGGGGASTVGYNTQNGSSEITGGGGGGGSSFVAANSAAGSVSGISGSSVGKITTASRTNGANGSIVLNWVMCDYDLAVTKTANSSTAVVGGTITWTVSVENVGTTQMTQGDTVTLADSLPGGGTTSVVSVTTTGGSIGPLVRDAVTCNTTVGSAMPSAVTCTRPYQIVGGSVSGVRGIDPGEKITIVYTQTVTAAAGGSIANQATITDRKTGDTNDTTTTTVTIVTPPTAVNDTSFGNVLGSTVVVNAPGNDLNAVGSTVTLYNTTTNTPITSPYVVANEGTWTVAADGKISFAPLGTFYGDPTPVTYRIANATGQTATATVTVTYLPKAVDDTSLNNPVQTTATKNVLTNDQGIWNTSTLRIVSGATEVTSLPITNQGTWNVSGSNITFTPLATFFGDPAPVDYVITDTSGDKVGAKLTVTYVPIANNDTSTGNTLNTPVTKNVLTNDVGTFDLTTLRIVSGATRVTSLAVTNQGTWTANTDGTITFAPLAAFKGDPTPITYAVRDTTNDEVTATLTVSYLATVSPDTNLGNAAGSTVSTNVVTNDNGNFVANSVRIMSGGNALNTLTVIGQGIWTVSGNSISFAPEAGYYGDPSPITYRVTDATRGNLTSTLTVTYVPRTTNDTNPNNPVTQNVTTNVLANDTGTWNTGSLRIRQGGVDLQSLTVAGQGVWTANADGTITFDPDATYFGDPTPITYAITDTTGDTVTGTLTVTYLPKAVNDSNLGNALDATVSTNVIANDLGTWAAGNLRIVSGASNVTSLFVPTQGTWNVVGNTSIEFDPVDGFLTDPTPITYTNVDTTGDRVVATLTVTYLPQAVNDTNLGNVMHSTVTTSVLSNDKGVFTPNTVRIQSGSGPVSSLPVTNQGTWTANSDGTITFVPLNTFYGDPTAITYAVTDVTGDTVTATLTVTYLPRAVNDSSDGHLPLSAATINVFTNDIGQFNGSTLRLVSGATTVTSLPVTDEGVWEVFANGTAQFTPNSGFYGDPTPVTYRVTDITGDIVEATVGFDYVPVAVDDTVLDLAVGTTVNVAVFGNDLLIPNPTTLRIVDGASLVTSLPVTGGVWSVQGSTIRFVPNPGFEETPAPITYSVTDTSGDTDTATVTLGYAPKAHNDVDLNNTLDQPVTVTVLANDSGAAAVTVSLVGADGAGTIIVPTEGTWSVSGSTVVFTPLGSFHGNPTPIEYRITDARNNTSTATVTVTYLPAARDDLSTGNELDATVDVSVLTNDYGTYDDTTLRIIGAGNSLVNTLAVTGQGTWTVRPNGVIRFDPEAGYVGDPTPIRYSVEDTAGNATEAKVTVVYLARANNDFDLLNPFGSTVDVTPLANDNGDFTGSTVKIVSGASLVSTLTVTDEGTWTVEAGNVIRFVPLTTFLTDPTPIRYAVEDATGHEVRANVTVSYVPLAVDDVNPGNAIGDTVGQNVLLNDKGDFVVSSLRIENGTARVTSLNVPGQGTWTVVGSIIEFDPEADFLVDPTPIRYEVTDSTGDKVSALLTIGYVPEAVNDSSSGNDIGDIVTQSVLANDNGSFGAAVPVLVHNNTRVSTYTVTGQGTWTVIGKTVRFEPAGGFYGDPTPAVYEITDVTGDTVDATVSVDYLPEALDDVSAPSVIGSTVEQNVLSNDHAIYPANPVLTIVSGASRVTTLVVPNEGTWNVLTGGRIEFVPLGSFTSDPTPITYEATDLSGDKDQAAVAVDYTSVAADDSLVNQVLGATVSKNVLTNDTGSFDTTTLRIDHNGTLVSTLTVADQGTWTVRANGVIEFDPIDGFLVDPDPITYAVKDLDGATVSADFTVAYLPTAVADSDLGNTLGETVTINVLANDTGDFTNSLQIVVGGVAGTEFTVTNEGTWKVVGTNSVSFEPLGTFYGDPAPIDYRITDSTGDTVSASIVVSYLPKANDNASTGHTIGATVTQDVLSDDDGSFVDSTLRIKNGAARVTELVVSNQGTWRVVSPRSISFEPIDGFLVDPTPIEYEITDITGDKVSAEVAVEYVPAAANNSSTGNALRATVTVNVLANDTGDFDESTLAIRNGAGLPVQSLVVAGQGTWTVVGPRSISFEPLSTFLGDPTFITYEITDVTGDTVTARLTVAYVPEAKNDTSAGNTTGDTVDVDVLANDEGDFDDTTLVIVNGAARVTSLLVPNEGTWTVLAGGHLEFEPLGTFLGDPTFITYEITDTTGDTVSATVTVSYSPEAIDDSSTGNAIGDTVTVNVLGNDVGAFDDTTLTIKDGAARVSTLLVPNQGTWTVLTGGRIEFEPLPGFEGDPTPIEYEVEDITGDVVSAGLAVDYEPEAKADTSSANTLGSTVIVNVLTNDLGVFDETSLVIVDGLARVTSLLVPNEGTWTVLTGGRLQFEPLPGFEGDPTPIDYEITDVSGDTDGASVTVLYVPEAVNDVKNNNTLFQPATVNVLANDNGDLVVSSIRLIDPVTLATATSVTVANQGTWTVDTSSGDVTFTPLATYQGNPTPIVYVVTDSTGDTVDATVTFSYRPVASNDTSTGNVVGKPVTVDVVGNDVGSLDPTSVRIVTPGTGALVTSLVVPGEGTWRVDPVTGAITFTPVTGFTGDPTPITYQVTDSAGVTTTAQLSVDYLQIAAGLVITGADVMAPLLAALVAMLLGGLAIIFARKRRAQAQR